MWRRFPVLALLAAAGALLFRAQTAAPRVPQSVSHPDFKPTPEVPAMPKALMKLPRTEISRAKFSVVDFHLHARSLQSAEDYRQMIRLMDETGIGLICNMD